MHYEAIQRWLGAWAKKHSQLNALTSAGAFFLSLLLLGFTWLMIEVFGLFILGAINPKLLGNGWLQVLVPLAIITSLFWTTAKTPQEQFGDISVTPVGSDSLVIIPGLGANINPIAPDSINATAKMAVDCLCAGPRAFNAGVGLVRRALRLRRLDVDQTAAVLTLLYQARGKQTYQEIADGVEGVDLAATIPPMRDIDGVVFFNTEPAGMSTTQELRDELLNAISQG